VHDDRRLGLDDKQLKHDRKRQTRSNREEISVFPKSDGGSRDQYDYGEGKSVSALKRYVSFYFTNFPVNLSRFYLWKGFEVYGILEDIYVARKHNKQGQPYGFVKFSNVRNISKLTKALNAVSFGHFCVRASVERFDRSDKSYDETERGGVKHSNVR
jgi:hypothetical protein